MNKQSSLADNEINFESLSEYLTKRYPDREILIDKWPYLFKEFIDELYKHGLNTIGKIHKALDRTKEAFGLFEKDFPPNPVKDSQYSIEGVGIISMRLLDSDFFTCRNIILNDVAPEKLEEYRKHILPERE